MALPDLIEIVPLEKPVHAEITVPGSKSITNRALILAALANGQITLRGALWSEDTQVMVDCLQRLGFQINVENDPEEPCNRTITVHGLNGKIPKRGTAEKPLELFVGNAGTAARFLSAFVCLGDGVYRLSGVPRMHERPQAALFKALRELGYRVESENGNDKLPVRISHRATENAEKTEAASVSSAPLWQNKSCTVSIAESSQFASALLLCAETGGWKIKVVDENAEESPYVAMTTELIKVFPKNGIFQIEPDASSGSYFWAAGVSMGIEENVKNSGDVSQFLRTSFKWSVSVYNWPTSDWQIDEEFPLELMNLVNSAEGFGFPWELKQREKHGHHWREKLKSDEKQFAISRKDRLGDSIMTLIVISPFNICPVPFTDLGRLRLQECERVVALRTELTKCGAKVIEEGDTLTVYPSKLHGAEIETYHDHRMAMCFAILGLKVPGIKIKNPACVKKTFPNFFQKLAALPPHGLGVKIYDAIRDPEKKRPLTEAELFAD